MNWRFGISSGSCVDAPILDVLPALKQGGATAIEVGTPPRHFDPSQADQVAALGRGLVDLGLRAVSTHAPFGAHLDLADSNPLHRERGIKAILTAATAIKQLGGDLVVVHPSDLERRQHDTYARLIDSARSLNILAAECRNAGLTLLIESPLPHLIGGHPDEFAWLLEHIDASARVCLDTGHTSLGHHWHRFVEASGPRIAHVHAHDNHGHWDDHLPPGDGVVDWPGVARSLAGAGFDGWVMLELSCPPADPAAHYRRALDRAAEMFNGRFRANGG